MRLDAYLSRNSTWSRKEAGLLIRSGRVTLNGKVLRNRGLNLDPKSFPLLQIDGKDWPPAFEECSAPPLHWLLHKPAGQLTASRDPHQPTVRDNLPPAWQKSALQPVGRLDKDTTGLLLFTQDGQLNHRLSSPKWKIAKRYLFTYTGEPLDQSSVEAMARGFRFKEGQTAPAQLLPEAADASAWRMTLPPSEQGVGSAALLLTEGRYHEVKRLVSATRRQVLRLHRSTLGSLELLDLTEGSGRILSQEEIAQLYQEVNLVQPSS